MFNPDEAQEVERLRDAVGRRVKELDKEDLYKGIKDYILEQMKNGAVK